MQQVISNLTDMSKLTTTRCVGTFGEHGQIWPFKIHPLHLDYSSICTQRPLPGAARRMRAETVTGELEQPSEIHPLGWGLGWAWRGAGTPCDALARSSRLRLHHAPAHLEKPTSKLSTFVFASEKETIQSSLTLRLSPGHDASSLDNQPTPA